MADSQIEVCKMACVEVGLEPIGTIDDDSKEALVLRTHYDTIVEDALSSHWWRFAMAQQVLNKLADDPAGRWEAAFQIPAEVLSIRAVTVTDKNIDFERYGDKIYCDADGTLDVVLDASYDTPEINWPGYFVRYVVLKLAAILASGVREDSEMTTAKEEGAEIQWRRAKHRNSTESSTKRIRPFRITSARQRRMGLGNRT